MKALKKDINQKKRCNFVHLSFFSFTKDYYLEAISNTRGYFMRI